MVDLHEIIEMLLSDELLKSKPDCGLVDEFLINQPKPLGLFLHGLVIGVDISWDDVIYLECLEELQPDHAIDRSVLLVSEALDGDSMKLPKSVKRAYCLKRLALVIEYLTIRKYLSMGLNSGVYWGSVMQTILVFRKNSPISFVLWTEALSMMTTS